MRRLVVVSVADPGSGEEGWSAAVVNELHVNVDESLQLQGKPSNGSLL